MIRTLWLGLLCLSLLSTLTACVPPSVVTHPVAVNLPPAASSQAPVQAADLWPTVVTGLQDMRLTGNAPGNLAKVEGGLDSCNADKEKVRKDLKLSPPPC